MDILSYGDELGQYLHTGTHGYNQYLKRNMYKLSIRHCKRIAMNRPCKKSHNNTTLIIYDT